jgi:hypothetical protein
MFLFDNGLNPWVQPPVYVPYSENDSRRIECGLREMLSLGEGGRFPKKALLVPLAPLRGDIVYCVAITREDRVINIVQYRPEFFPGAGDGAERVRSIQVSANVQASYPHITFISSSPSLSPHRGRDVFWNSLRDTWNLGCEKISIFNPTPIPDVGGDTLRYRSAGHGFGVANQQVAGFEIAYDAVFDGRIKIVLRQMCAPLGLSTMVVYETPDGDGGHSVAMIRRGTDSLVNVVDCLSSVGGERFSITERMVIFPPVMTQLFPGFEFESVQLTDAEKLILFREPVLDRYRAASDARVFKHYHAPRRVALAWALHARVVRQGTCAISRFSRELVIRIANMAL